MFELDWPQTARLWGGSKGAVEEWWEVGDGGGVRTAEKTKKKDIKREVVRVNKPRKNQQKGLRK